MCLEQTLGFQPPLGMGDFWKVPVGLMLRDVLALLHHSHQEPPVEAEPCSAPGHDGHEVGCGLSAPPGPCWQRFLGSPSLEAFRSPPDTVWVAPQWGWDLPGPFPALAPCDGPGGQKRGKGNAAAPSPARQSQLPDPAHGEGKKNPGTSQPTETSTDTQHEGLDPSPPPAGTCKSNSSQASSNFRASSRRHLTEHGSINHLALIFFSQGSSTWLFPGGGTDHKHEPANLRRHQPERRGGRGAAAADICAGRRLTAGSELSARRAL